MRYLGIDYGAKRIGLSISSEGIAFPRGVVANDAGLIPLICDIVEKERVGAIVVGDTRAYSGRENQVTKEAETFIEQLKEKTSLSVVAATESGTSIEASRYAPDEEKHDDAAAAVILQRYLDMQGSALE